ncbi:hypothetical protein [Nocardia terpenica]|uniref:Uncharacterized protein n=1 Tax=Nocardia terpenica TaxID=455432 RepID=A0A164JI07_9NOCA|nr:hypothetical protein [Nocardia terpenica]KZM70422.1 hypothetical protein AWN90_03845 [Nocardia terpenica]NQE91104.1 hypothetical protein [Nocardia terpenica]
MNRPRPTPAQQQILQAIQNRIAETAGFFDRGMARQRRVGDIAARSWYRELTARQGVCRLLQDAACAGGVPRTWIDQVRARGEQRIRWRSDVVFGDPEPVDRDGLLAALAADSGMVRDVSIAVAVLGETDAGTAHRVQQRLDLVWDRTVALSHLLDVTAEESVRLWGVHRGWAARAAVSVLSMPPGAAHATVREFASGDLTRTGLQGAVLRAAGLTAAVDHAPPRPAHLVKQIDAALAQLGAVLTQISDADRLGTATAASPDNSGARERSTPGPSACRPTEHAVSVLLPVDGGSRASYPSIAVEPDLAAETGGAGRLKGPDPGAEP